MTFSDPSKHRREANEAVFRARNEGVKAIIDPVLPGANKSDFKLRFTCECSNEYCHDIVELSADEYEQIRTNPRKFIVRPGHQQADIERLVYSDGYSVVEKVEEPPPTDGRLNHTR